MGADYSGATIAPLLLVLSTAGALVGVACYVALGLGLSRLFEKLGGAGWKGWTPFLQLGELYRLGGASPIWVISLVFPVIHLAGLVVLCVAVHAIGARLRLGAGYTVLAVVALPVWALVVGFGRAAPAPDGPHLVDRVARMSEPGEREPWEPRAPAPYPAASPGPAAPPAPDDPLDRTVLAPRRRALRWVLTPENGAPIELVGTDFILGRRPAPSAERGVEAVAVPDPWKTVSKTHARIRYDGEAWSITDLSSTNGVVLIAARGEEVDLESDATARLTETFRLGRLQFTLRAGE